MDNKRKYSTSQLFNFAKDSYLERTSRPIYAIVFLLPFIIFYELGTILINTDVLNQTQVRVAAFVWLQKSFEYLGFGSKLAWMAPPLVVVAILTALQLTSRKRWHFWFADFRPMAVECILLAAPLVVLTLFLNTSRRPQANTSQLIDSTRYAISSTQYNSPIAGCSSVANEDESTAEAGDRRAGKKFLLADIVTSIGAGIYEELVFRLILICVLMIVFQNILRLGQKNSIILSVLISAALFSVHHHIDFLSGQLNQTDPFNLMRFVFRTIAGIYFAILFAIRGFGITAGTHAFYDIIAVLIRAIFFQQ